VHSCILLLASLMGSNLVRQSVSSGRQELSIARHVDVVSQVGKLREL